MLLLEDKLTKYFNAIDVPYSFSVDEDGYDEEDTAATLESCLIDGGIRSENFWIGLGASKAVIIPNDTAFVLKTPFFGCHENTYPIRTDENGKEYTDYDSDPEYEFYEYSGATAIDNDELPCNDYCALEAYYYEKALAAGVDECFAGTRFFGWADKERPVYISEKCHEREYHTEPSDSSSAYVKKQRSAANLDNIWDCMSTDITALFIDDYGVEKTIKLLQFIYDNDITDLHSGNIMISDKTGKIVISDYSGFHS